MNFEYQNKRHEGDYSLNVKIMRERPGERLDE